jgi:hypothetical protein
MRIRPSMIACLATLGALGACDDGGELALTAADRAVTAVDESIQQARTATARYHDLANAAADGFEKVGACQMLPDGSTAQHYFKLSRFDTSVSLAEPEGLLYVPTAEGEMKLVGIEHIWLIFQDGKPYFGCGVENPSCPPQVPAPAPIYGDVPLEGPFPGHVPGMPWHYEQHAWIWSKNPAGTFAARNSGIRCLRTE